MSHEQSKTEQPRARARARSAKQLARQEQCFDLSVVNGKTIREISAEVGVTQETVISDIRAEELRRSEQNAARREMNTARAISFYERIIGMALERAKIAKNILQQIEDGTGYTENEEGHQTAKRVSDRYLDTAIHARERIDKLLGLDAPTKVELDASKNMTDEEIQESLQRLRHKKEAREQIKNAERNECSPSP